MAKQKPLHRMRPPKDGALYRAVWRVVDGAVMDALKMHPEYIRGNFGKCARMSINKRVVGSLVGYVEQSTQGRLTAAKTEHRATRRDVLGSAWDKCLAR